MAPEQPLTPGPPTADPTRPEPATAEPVRDRIDSLDVLRGFALLGILGPNIALFGWPQAALTDPALMGGGAANEFGHAAIGIFFHGKMMMLFAILFGSGVEMYARKFDHARGRGTGQWYRRCAWLLLIGLLHALFIWFGDILVLYALCGMMLPWWARRWQPSTQLAIGTASFLFGSCLLIVFALVGVFAAEAEMIDAAVLHGDPAGEIKAYSGPWAGALAFRALTVIPVWATMLLIMSWVAQGLMLWGMALTRLGILTGERSTGFYRRAALLFLPTGLALTVGCFFALRALTEHSGMLWAVSTQLIGTPLSLGYAAALLWIVRTGALRGLSAALGRVGRMALSNYLLQSLLCTTLFYGHAGGLYATVAYPWLAAIVLGVWIVNVLFSFWWLRRFRFGPAEWIWRSLTYWRPQPMRR